MIAYRLLWLLAWPLVVVCTLLHPRLRGSWRERLGWSLPVWPPGAVLLHGSSLGEGVAASALAEGLRSLENPPLCLRTAFTDTGLQAAREQGLATVLPWDAPGLWGAGSTASPSGDPAGG